MNYIKKSLLIFIMCLFPIFAWGAESKITNLGAISSVAADDPIAIVDVSEDPDITKKVSIGEFVALAYFADSSEADQGIAGSGRSVKDLVDLIGSNNATIVFIHHGSANTDYVFGTNETIPANITLRFQNGARISVSTAKTLTIETTSIIAKGSEEIFTGAGSYTFADGTEVASFWFATFETAVTKIGSDNVRLTVSKASSIADNCAVNANTALSIPSKGRILTVANTKTLTINGPFDAGLYQMFSGAGSVVLGEASIPAVYPEWWGIDGTADEVEINKALTAAVNVLQVELQSKDYMIADSVILSTDYMSLVCHSTYSTLKTPADIEGVVLSAQYMNVENIKVWTTHAASTKAGFKLGGTAKVMNCRLDKTAAFGFKYGYELYSTDITEGVGYNEFTHMWTNNTVDDDVYIHCAGTGWVNENHFWGGNLHCASTGRNINIASYCTQNIFTGVSFENANEYKFAVIDHGVNIFNGCRFEVHGHGVYAHNNSGDPSLGTQVLGSLWVLTTGKVRIACADGYLTTDSWLNRTGTGLVRDLKTLNTTVDQNSAAAQKILYITSTSTVYNGSNICIDEGNANEEWGVVDSVDPGVSITLYGNLRYTHTAADTHTVASYGTFYGVLPSPADGNTYKDMNFFVGGIKVLTLAYSEEKVNALCDIYRNGTKIISTQQTGVSAMTNVTTPANLDANTVSTAELADIVGTLINKLRTHGLVAN